MRAAALIATKDLRQRLRDRSAILVAVVVPLALAAVLGAVIPDAGDGDISLRYAVVEGDRGQAARAFGDGLRRLEREGVIALRRAPSSEEARRLADAGDVDSAFVLPAGFSAAVASGAPAELSVIGSAEAPLGTLVARSIAASYTSDLAAVRVAVAAAVADGDRSPPPVLAQRAAAAERPVGIEDVSAQRKELDPQTFYAAGMAIFFVFFTAQFGVSSILEERRAGTLARLAAAPVPRMSILFGKLLTSVALGLVSMAALAAATSLLLGAQWGDPLGVALLVIAAVLAATAVTALVATLARTTDQAASWQSIVALVLGMLGGSFFPVAVAGGLLGTLSLLTPHAWFLRGLGDLRGGGGASVVLPAVGAILAFAGVAGTAAALRARRLLRP